MASFTELKSGSYMKTPRFGRERKYEIHFPHNYLPHHPWGELPRKDTPIALPVVMVSHATHQEQVSQIALHRNDGHYYRFTPHKKFGKSYNEDGRPPGESHRYILNHIPDEHTPSYQPIPDTEPVFPGYYSWWGLAKPPNVSDIPTSPFLPGYLRDPPESFYGRRAFVSSFSDLLQSYASSRGCRDIYLKVGGTLRYKREIGYVVIVCTSHDLGALNSYRPITHAPPDMFKHNGLVNDDGKVIDITKVPYFITQHIKGRSSSYETLGFGLYFGDDLIFPASTIREVDVDHYCIRRQPMRWCDHSTHQVKTELKCPDEITAEDRDENDRIRFCERFCYPIWQ